MAKIRRRMAFELSFGSSPAKFLHGPGGVPNFGHVPNPVAFEFHNVNIIRGCALPGWRHGTALASMGTGEDAICTDVFPLLIRCERFHRVSPIRYERQQAFHPISVFLQRLDIRQRLRLRRKTGGRRAICLTSIPTLSRFAGFEEFVGDFRDGGHVSIPLES